MGRGHERVRFGAGRGRRSVFGGRVGCSHQGNSAPCRSWYIVILVYVLLQSVSGLGLPSTAARELITAAASLSTAATASGGGQGGFPAWLRLYYAAVVRVLAWEAATCVGYYHEPQKLLRDGNESAPGSPRAAVAFGLSAATKLSPRPGSSAATAQQQQQQLEAALKPVLRPLAVVTRLALLLLGGSSSAATPAGGSSASAAASATDAGPLSPMSPMSPLAPLGQGLAAPSGEEYRARLDASGAGTLAFGPTVINLCCVLLTGTRAAGLGEAVALYRAAGATAVKAATLLASLPSTAEAWDAKERESMNAP